MIYSETMRQNEADLREKMKTLVANLKPEQQRVFRLMYNPKGAHENDVDGVKPEQLDWAFKQIENTTASSGASP